jgi:putative transposase
MPRKGHTEEQILYALRQAEAGKKAGDICRELGVSQQAFYSWKRRYAGLGLNELRELRQLREEYADVDCLKTIGHHLDERFSPANDNATSYLFVVDKAGDICLPNSCLG